MVRFFNRVVGVILLYILIECKNDETSLPSPIPSGVINNKTKSPYLYEIDLNNITNDTFNIVLHIDSLTEANNIFHFPSTVPGVYELLNFGRYISSFKAFDKNNKEISVEHSSINQWTITKPNEVSIITYKAAETFAFATHYGSNIDSDAILINPASLLGYFSELQNSEFQLKVSIPSNWSIGTSLKKIATNQYSTTDYSSLVDSPLLMGKLSNASTVIANKPFDLFVYSKEGTVTANKVLADAELGIVDVSKFLKTLSEGKYTFLYYFKPGFGGGALEHTNSSLHIQPSAPYSSSEIRNRVTHEFFHTLTPLNIRSEVISNFNFEVPTASAHIWMYEGVTVYLSHMMQYRNQSMDINVLLKELSSRAKAAKSYGNVSLTQTSLGIYTTAGAGGYIHAYYRGVIVAALLDIKLLTLSQGNRGLREVMLELNEIYSSTKPFSEKHFIEDLTKLTYPEIEAFLDSYILGSESLPIKEYFKFLGIDFDETTSVLIPGSNSTEGQSQLFNRWSRNL